MTRRQLARVAAPVAFLAAVTIGALVAHSELRHDAAPPTTTATTQTTVTTTSRKHAKKHNVRTYRIRSGDTLGSIAHRLGTTVARLERLNPGVDPTALRVGEKIRVE